MAQRDRAEINVRGVMVGTSVFPLLHHPWSIGEADSGGEGWTDMRDSKVH